MISRRYLGLDVTPGELRAVVLQRRQRVTRLIAGRVAPLPEGVLVPSLRARNILDRPRLVASLRDVLNPLAEREERLSVSLPDAAGRLLLAEVESPFKSRAEGEEVLRWQLKNSLPGEGKSLRLDFQVLGRRENGRVQLAVTTMAAEVLDQYEEILGEAGYHPSVIDFHSLHLYNFYRPRLDIGGDAILVAVEGGVLGLHYLEGHRLAFHRAREVGADSMAVFRELRRTLVGAVGSCPGMKRAEVFVHSDWSEREELTAALNGLFEREVTWLEPHLQRLAVGPLELPAWQLCNLTAAVGAAERFL